MKQIIYKILVISIFFALSCRKDKHIYILKVKGQVVDMQTGAAIPNILVAITKRVLLPSGGFYFTPLDTIRSDSYGNYSLAYEVKQPDEYFVSIEFDEWVRLSYGIGGYNSDGLKLLKVYLNETQDEQNVKLAFSPSFRVKFNLRSKSLNSDSTVFCFLDWANAVGSELCFYGNRIDTVITYESNYNIANKLSMTSGMIIRVPYCVFNSSVLRNTAYSFIEFTPVYNGTLDTLIEY